MKVNNLILQNSVIKMLILNSNPRVAGISTKYMRKHFEIITLIKKKEHCSIQLIGNIVLSN